MKQQKKHYIRNIDLSLSYGVVKNRFERLMKNVAGRMQCSASLESWDF
jgi:hypothetical protein